MVLAKWKSCRNSRLGEGKFLQGLPAGLHSLQALGSMVDVLSDCRGVFSLPKAESSVYLSVPACLFLTAKERGYTRFRLNSGEGSSGHSDCLESTAC